MIAFLLNDLTFKYTLYKFNVLYANDLNILSSSRFKKYNNVKDKITAKIRSTQEPTEVSYEIIDENNIKIIFKEYQKSIATGQSVVLYEDDVVIAGGIIDRVE